MNDFTAIPCITIIAYLCAEIFKLFTKQKFNEFVPVLCGAVGAILGALAYFFFPDFIPNQNLFFSIATGIVSGFSATGINQMYKQMTSKVNENDDN